MMAGIVRELSKCEAFVGIHNNSGDVVVICKTDFVFPSYSSRFTVIKGAGGVLDLSPRVKNLAAYDDFIIQPSVSPTNIPCEQV